MQIKKLVGTFSLDKFTKYDIRSLSYYEYLVIDMTAIREPDEVVIKNLIAINALYDMRIILFADEIEPERLKKLITVTKIYNIITETEIKGIKNEMLLCVSPGGMPREYILNKISAEHGLDFADIVYTFTGPGQTKIVIAGVMPRVGTTTTALNIASYLTNIGARVSYTEANKQGHLKAIRNVLFPNSPIKGNYFTGAGIDYFFNFNIPNDSYDFNVLDLGVLVDANVNVFNRIGDVKVLCAGNKPYEIKALEGALKKLTKTDYHVLLPQGEVMNINKYLPNHEHYKIQKIKYANALFDESKNKKVWETLLSQYIVRRSMITI